MSWGFPMHFTCSSWLSKVKVTNINSFYIQDKNDGGLDISNNISCSSNCRENDFTEWSSMSSVSDPCAWEKGGGCCV